MKKLTLILFLLLTTVVFSQRRRGELWVYEGSITSVDEIFKLEKKGVFSTFRLTNWVYVYNNTIYSVGIFDMKEYDSYIYVLIEDITLPMSTVYKMTNLSEYKRLSNTMDRYGFQLISN